MSQTNLISSAVIAPRFRRVVLPHSPGILSVAPYAVPLSFQGQQLVTVPHDATHVKLARNFGVHVDAPILHYYNWPNGPAFHAQKMTAAMLTVEDRSYVLNDMGTGKTRTVCWAFDFLQREKLATRMLVVAPLSTLGSTWKRELFNTVPHLKVNILHGNKQKRLTMLNDPADVYIINHDGVEVIWKELAKRPDIDVVVLDELAAYRNGKTNRFKVMRTLLNGTPQKPRVWGMTGSPIPNGPTDAWAQVKLVTPWQMPQGFTHFRESTMLKVSNFLWKQKPSALETVHRAMQPAVRFALDEVTELPQKIVRTVQVPFGPKQQSTYDALVRNLHVMATRGEITVANAGILTNKLIQVATGWVYTDDGSVEELDNGTRLDAMVDHINATTSKVLVFAPYIHTLTGLSARLAKEGINHASVSGSTPIKERTDIFGRFQSFDNLKVIVAHPQCMSHGLTLTAADTIIWFAPFPSLDIFEQANRRITRIGQDKKQQIIQFSGCKEEEKVYRSLQTGQFTQQSLLDLFT